MGAELEKVKRVLAEAPNYFQLEERSKEIEELLSEDSESDVERGLSDYRKWKAQLSETHQVLNCLPELFEGFSGSHVVGSPWKPLMTERDAKMRGIEIFLTRIEARIKDLEDLRRGKLEWEQADLTKRSVHAAELANTIAAVNSEAAKVSASAAKQSAQVARHGFRLTKKMFWAAVFSALVAVGALIGQIYSQNKDISVNLNSPVALQPVTLSDESISNLTHSIAVELSKMKDEQVTLSPESIEDLRAVLRLELERDAHIEVVETKENVEQKAN
ncbi:hypothetical protein ACJJIE_02400 [Microbulbifer sp. TRSA001]|uniref:hypothetical protein n=1 Tax=Microbulbifer sp. TRSA001 TaxID=3243381 RepID=UPI00403A530C